MAYLKDPREMAIHVESGMGMTLEMDNRWETMYHWGAMVLDLCDMPISEYMKPGFGPGSGDSEYDEYQLTFMNGDVIISQTMVKFQQKIVYPSMEDYTDESGVTWTFIWDDTSYNGLPMPSMDLVITGQYVVKPEIAIYYGSFVVPVSAFNADDINQYYDEDDVNNTFKSIAVKDCIGGNATISVEIPPYEPFNNLSILGYQRERKKYYSPLAFLFPASVVSDYDITITDIVGINWWDKYLKSDETVMFNNEEYYFCVQVTDSLRPARQKQTLNYNLNLKRDYTENPYASIFYGSFVVPVSGFNSEDVNQYFNASEVSDTFQSVPVKDCIGKSVSIGVEIPPYEEFNSLSIVGYQKERKNYYSPLVFMFPASVVSEHNISVTDIIGIDWWNKYIKPDKTVVYNGDEYFFCVQMTDGLRPARQKQTLNYNLKIE